MTILEFAKEILALSGSKSEIVYQAAAAGRSEGAPARHQPGPDLLGWEPKIDRHEGLKRTLAYFQQKVAAQARI